MTEHPPRLRTAPTLWTERLVLRAHEADDRDESAVMWADPEVTRFIGGRPSTRESAWGRVLTYAGLWSTLGYGYWALRDRATDAFVGEVGLADFRRMIEPPFEGAPEVGWALLPSARRRGLGREAVAAALAWSDLHVPTTRTVCMISPENVASIRLAERVGFRAYARTTYREGPVHLFERHLFERLGRSDTAGEEERHRVRASAP